jgi:transcriptional regulator GlxA family with amidase domain
VDPRIARTIAVMEEQLDQPLRIADLAAQLNLSPSRYRSLFRAECGCLPREFLRALRMDRARVLLAEAPLLVKQVMSEVGVSDASHFLRDFKSRFGESPSAFRARIQRQVVFRPSPFDTWP